MIRKTPYAALACSVLLLTARAGDCPPPPIPGVDPLVPGQAMVRVADDSDLDAFLALFNRPGTTVIGAIEPRRTYLLQLPPGTDECAVDLQLDTLENPNPQIPDPNRPLVWGELNYEGQAAEGKTGSIYVGGPAASVARYQTQYALNLLGVNTAQARSTGATTVVAVLDTGIDATHPQLAGRVLPFGFNFVNNSPDTSDRGDGVNNDPHHDNLVDEMVGHGTYVAGLIALVAPNTRLLPVVVLNSDGVGEAFAIGQGMYYAIDRGVEVINMSLGSTYRSEIISDAIEEARRLGIPVVGSAGNLNREDPREFPATVSNAVGVASTDRNDRRSSFSNYHGALDLSAPGSSERLPNNEFDPDLSIISTIPNAEFAMWEGTSMSAAFVSAAVAMVRSQHPEWPAGERTHELIEQVLIGTAVDIDPLNPGYEGRLGAGRLDIAGAVNEGPVAPRPGDINNDGLINLADLGILLADWGLTHSPAVLDGDGVVGLSDLGFLLSVFGT